MTGTEVYGREHVSLLTAAEAAGADREARERYGIPERVLMENAGRAAAAVVMRLYPRGRVVAVVGSGHNGGDGLVALRALRTWGREVGYIAAGSGPPDPSLLHGHEIPGHNAEDAAEVLADAGVVLDGILGTGATGAPRDPAAGMIGAMNGAGRPIVALDLPSGIDPTTGQVPGAAVAAAVTVSFGWPKRGLLLHPARELCGRVLVVEIGFPPWPADRQAGAALITPAWAAARLPARPADAHKASSGRLLILAGKAGMGGAAALAGRAAVRAGAGLVRLVSPGSNRVVLQTLVPDAVFVDRDDPAALASACEGVAAVVAGPGLGVDEDARTALDRVLAALPGVPALLDADALNELAPAGGRLMELAAGRPLVLTPHPGEFSRLTGAPVPEIRAAPLEAAVELADRVGCTVLLKGAPSVVAARGEPVLVNTVGSSDVAKAGMGDHLSGVVGAFLATGLAPREAAAAGLYYSGRAADLAGLGRSLSPDDASAELHRAFRAPGAAEPPLGLPFITFDQPSRR